MVNISPRRFGSVHTVPIPKPLTPPPGADGVFDEEGTSHRVRADAHTDTKDPRLITGALTDSSAEKTGIGRQEHRAIHGDRPTPMLFEVKLPCRAFPVRTEHCPGSLRRSGNLLPCRSGERMRYPDLSETLPEHCAHDLAAWAASSTQTKIAEPLSPMAPTLVSGATNVKKDRASSFNCPVRTRCPDRASSRSVWSSSRHNGKLRLASIKSRNGPCPIVAPRTPNAVAPGTSQRQRSRHPNS